MKIGIITAMPEEYQAVAVCFGSVGVVRAGALRTAIFHTKEHEFLVVESGMGFDNAARAAEALMSGDCPDLLITAGFCGGIAPELQVGDVVVAKQIVIVTGNGPEEVPVCFSAAGQNFVARESGMRVFGGLFASTPVIMSKTRLAGMLPAVSTNPVVEMESAAVAIIAVENSIPLLAIRAVSDTADEELDFSLDEFCDRGLRRIRIHKVLLTVLRKPRIIPQLVRLSRNSRVAANSLTAALSRLFPTL